MLTARILILVGHRDTTDPERGVASKPLFLPSLLRSDSGVNESTGTMPYSNSRAPPPTEDYLYNLYEQVRLGFESESSTSLNDVRDSMNGDEVGRIIDDYGGQNGAGRSDLPKYDKSRTPTSPPLEKGSYLTCLGVIHIV